MLKTGDRLFVSVMILVFVAAACGIIRDGGGAEMVMQMIGRTAYMVAGLVLAVAVMYWGHSK